MKTFYLICDTNAGLFEDMPKIEAKNAKDAVNKYLKEKNPKLTAKFVKNGNGSIVAQKLKYFENEDKFYREWGSRTTTYDPLEI